MKNQYKLIKAVSIAYASFIIAVIILLTIGFIFTGFSGSTRNVVIFSILVLSLIAFFIFIVFIIKITLEQSIKKNQDDIMAQQIRNHIATLNKIQKHDEKILKIHHDIKNHLGVLRSMLLDNNSRQAEEYIKKLQNYIHSEDKNTNMDNDNG